jgi:hypothetical protein
MANNAFEICAQLSLSLALRSLFRSLSVCLSVCLSFSLSLCMRYACQKKSISAMRCSVVSAVCVCACTHTHTIRKCSSLHQPTLIIDKAYLLMMHSIHYRGNEYINPRTGAAGGPAAYLPPLLLSLLLSLLPEPAHIDTYVCARCLCVSTHIHTYMPETCEGLWINALRSMLFEINPWDRNTDTDTDTDTETDTDTHTPAFLKRCMHASIHTNASTAAYNRPCAFILSCILYMCEYTYKYTYIHTYIHIAMRSAVQAAPI